jgi:hypothetical protein
MNKQRLIDMVVEDWGNKPQADICISIINYLYKRIDNPPSHITHGFLRKVAGNHYQDDDLLLAVQYLCGARLKLLEAKFEFIEDEEVFELSNNEVKQAQRTGFIIHPKTGEQVKSFEDKVFVYFEPEPLAELSAH